MNNTKYKWILYVIVLVILGTISIQIYWNYKNYLTNKQQLINDVQLCLDNAVESYYSKLAENETIAYAFETLPLDTLDHRSIDSLIHNIEVTGIPRLSRDSIDIVLNDDKTMVKIIKGDSLIKDIDAGTYSTTHKIRSLQKSLELDSLNNTHLRSLTSRVIISLTNDSLKLEEIDKLFIDQLMFKNIEISHDLQFDIFGELKHFSNKNLDTEAELTVVSKSPYLHFDAGLTANFNNPTKTILKRILSGILISSLLVLAVISCLFYLLKIIKHQKQLAEVKNDLISNITHEFKTPIATIGVALESIKNFDILKDKEKTTTYLDMSRDQLSKLNVMVEKLLETAVLDSDSLNLIYEDVDLVEFMDHLVNEHRLGIQQKSIQFKTALTSCLLKIDVFHFENAMNNVIDNAIKYGGDVIEVSLNEDDESLEILISDNGKSLTKASKDRIFEKFYRIPKGNTHDVKGFGIGLYYARSIIEKHGGTIQLHLTGNLTTFKISLPL